MSRRGDALQLFIDSAFEAFGHFAQAPQSRGSILQISSALEVPGVEKRGHGSRLPVCSHLETALSIETEHEPLRRLIDRFRAVEPLLAWRRRTGCDGSESANFLESHANAMIVGPSGLEERSDVWLGVTLMAPHVRYPDHEHAPEEVYLVLSEGEFRQGEGEWFAPGLGGSFYNEPGIRHAMRSVDTPLLAFWALLAKPS